MRVLISLILLAAVSLRAQDATALTLDEAVRLAITRHQDVDKARAAADALKGKIREVRSQALPSIQIVADALRWRDPSLLNASGLDKFPEELRSALIRKLVQPGCIQET